MYKKRNDSETALTFTDKGLTEQHHKDSVKMQNILKQYAQGIMPSGAINPPEYGDYTDIPDYHAAQNFIADTNSMFEQIPSKIRAQFDNDAGKYLEFISDPANKDAMDQLGIDTSHIPDDWQPPLTDEQKAEQRLNELVDLRLQAEKQTTEKDA